MRNLVSRLDKLELNLKKLLHNLRVLEEENSLLKQENADLKYKLGNSSEKLTVVKDQEETEKEVKWKEDMSEKLNGYISEIDECIDSLKKGSFGE